MTMDDVRCTIVDKYSSLGGAGEMTLNGRLGKHFTMTMNDVRCTIVDKCSSLGGAGEMTWKGRLGNTVH